MCFAFSLQATKRGEKFVKFVKENDFKLLN